MKKFAFACAISLLSCSAMAVNYGCGNQGDFDDMAACKAAAKQEYDKSMSLNELPDSGQYGYGDRAEYAMAFSCAKSGQYYAGLNYQENKRSCELYCAQ